ncbi:uncharacterized protein LOC113239186 [Hyposmocoma kahamanoa]|uniref:uncharacterized protein LOC113239186 n=1 Tax=Hyposmocoma kahamanoa TaxID=1477025 RepID=UPI000E6DA566|nr:uncharacterized protein LOC113239186 [Hyposmocoma kahamanoa]
MADMQGFCCDDETGEITLYQINEETGEPLIENNVPPSLNDFRYNVTHSTTDHEKKHIKFPKGYLTKTKKFQSLKEKIMDGSNPVSYRMLLIPTVIMNCPSLLVVLLMVLEIYLHVRCHKKSKHLKDSSFYYQSPFHVVTSAFCGVCRDCNTASRIGHLQDQRRYRYDYLNSIAI